MDKLRVGQLLEGNHSFAELIVGTLSRGAVEGDAEEEDVSVLGDRTLTGEVVKVGRLLAPISKPAAIYGIGLNYASHTHQV